MFLENRQVELIKKAINDFKFMKEEIENFMERTKEEINFKKLSDFLLKFKGVDITNIDDYHVDYSYLDFMYNDLNMCIKYEREVEDEIVVSKVFEIYDEKTCAYIVEDFLCIEEWENLINTSKETMLEDAIVNLKYYESKNMEEDYKNLLDKIVVFLKENW